MEELHTLLARLDERLESLHGRLDTTSDKLDQILSKYGELNIRVRLLESKLDDASDCRQQIADLQTRINALEGENSRGRAIWSVVGNWVSRLAWVILAAWILYKFGIQSPNLP